MTNQQSHIWSARQLGDQNGRPHPGRPLMTSAGLEELRGELAQLRRRVSEEIALRLREARSYGDGSNNDEYHAVREEQIVLEARIASLENTVGVRSSSTWKQRGRSGCHRIDGVDRRPRLRR